MADFLTIAALVLLLSLLLGLIRVWRGPGAADRMLAAQLFGTTGVGIVLLLAVITDNSALFDIALVLSLLAAVAILAFVRRLKLEQSAADTSSLSAKTDTEANEKEGQ